MKIHIEEECTVLNINFLKGDGLIIKLPGEHTIKLRFGLGWKNPMVTDTNENDYLIIDGVLQEKNDLDKL